MKAFGFALLALPLASAYLTCSTYKYTKSMSSVPTRTRTITITTDAHVVHRRKTLTGDISTYISIIGKTTITVPTASTFYNMKEAPTSTSTWPYFYPTSVGCTSYKTIVRGPTRTTTTAYGYFSTNLATTLTSYVETSTAYAACATHADRKRPDIGPNIAREFQGKLITFGNTNASVFNPYQDDPILRIVTLNAQKCCEFVHAHANWTGFNWMDFEGQRYCYGFEGGHWRFFTYEFYDGEGREKGISNLYGMGPSPNGAFYTVVPGFST